MASYDEVSLNYLLYGHQALESVAGMGNLSGVREMRHTFSNCVALASLDFSGMDPSLLEGLAYAFGGCSVLATIWVDADWSLLSGASRPQTFYNCGSLVGTAGRRPGRTAVRATRGAGRCYFSSIRCPSL